MLIKLLWNIFLDALFPLSKAEEELFKLSNEEALATLTKAANPPTDGTYSVFAYKDDLVSKLIWNIKYKRNVRAVEIGSYALYKTIMNKIQPENGSKIVLVPMPISKRRFLERGFNQCHLLVDELLRIDNSNVFTVNKDILIRTIHSKRQTLKSRQDRLTDAKGIFGINENANISDFEQKILIIDDVITTGSTITEAMDTMKKAGFKDVTGFSLAH